MKVARVWRYAYRAVNEDGHILELFVSRLRDRASAEWFFANAPRGHSDPLEIVTDKSPTLASVIADLVPDAVYATDQYANNRIECDHGRRKARLRSVRRVKTDRTASVMIRAHAFVQNIRPGHYQFDHDPLRELTRFVGHRVQDRESTPIELAGNAPLVVLDDAGIEAAVEPAVFGSFFNAGQICTIANRVIVDASLHDEFVQRFVELTSQLQVGDPSDPSTFIGSVISRRQLDSVMDKVRRSVEGGGQLILGGEPVGPGRLTLPPQVIPGGNDLPTAQEEVFGPAITIVSARDEAHALELANDSQYGLSSAVHTSDRERGTRFALRLRCGMTHVNDSPVDEEDNTAYGGEGRSGLGRFGGSWSIDEFTTEHWVSVQHRRRPYPLGV